MIELISLSVLLIILILVYYKRNVKIDVEDNDIEI